MMTQKTEGVGAGCKNVVWVKIDKYGCESYNSICYLGKSSIEPSASFPCPEADKRQRDANHRICVPLSLVVADGFSQSSACAMRSASVCARASSLASTMMRSKGSVPDGRISTRPRSASSASHALISAANFSLAFQS